MFRNQKNHYRLALAFLCVGMMFSENACDSENNTNPNSSSSALKCLKFSDQGIASYANNYWDLNHDGCVSSAEAGLVSEIPAGAFYGNPNIRSLQDLNQFPNLTVIGNQAFANCINLTQVNLDHVTSIGYGAFAYCTSLEHVNVPGTASIADNAFEGCTKLDNSPSVNNSCTTGNTKCSDDRTNVLICNNNQWQVSENCGSDKECHLSTRLCVAKDPGSHCAAGNLKCSIDMTQSLICNNNDWQVSENCGSSKECHSDTGKCELKIAGETCETGTYKCSIDMTQSLVCNNNQWGVSENCGTEKICRLLSGLCEEKGPEDDCEDGSYRCTNDLTLSLVCNNKNWQINEDCGSAKECLQSTGLCVPNPEESCSPEEEDTYKCSDDRHSQLLCWEGKWYLHDKCYQNQICDPSKKRCVEGCLDNEEGTHKCYFSRPIVCEENEWKISESCNDKLGMYCNYSNGECEQMSYCGSEPVDAVGVSYNIDLPNGALGQTYDTFIGEHGQTAKFVDWCKSVNPNSIAMCTPESDPGIRKGGCYLECTEADLGKTFNICIDDAPYEVIKAFNAYAEYPDTDDLAARFVCKKVGDRYIYDIDYSSNSSRPIIASTCEYESSSLCKLFNATPYYNEYGDQENHYSGCKQCPDYCVNGCVDGVCACPESCASGICEYNGECWVPPVCPATCTKGCYEDGTCIPDITMPECSETQCVTGTGRCLNYDDDYHFKKIKWNVTADKLSLVYPVLYYNGENSCDIDWGDGTQTKVEYVHYNDPYLGSGDRQVGNNHTYKHPGVYTITTNCSYSLKYNGSCTYDCTTHNYLTTCEVIACGYSSHENMCGNLGGGPSHIIYIEE